MYGTTEGPSFWIWCLILEAACVIRLDVVQLMMWFRSEKCKEPAFSNDPARGKQLTRRLRSDYSCGTSTSSRSVVDEFIVLQQARHAA